MHAIMESLKFMENQLANVEFMSFWNMVEAIGTIVAACVALFLGLFSFWFTGWREKQQRKERHGQHVRLFKKELQTIKEELTENLKKEPSSKDVIIEGFLLTLIFDVLKESAMPNFKPENLEDVIRAYERVYEVKERRFQKRYSIEEIVEYVNKGIEALEKECLSC